ncbi:MAG: toprim domain-containing protein [Methylococcales bacterium]|nr:toprim domain-containing protein [Methylococcales bacterium]
MKIPCFTDPLLMPSTGETAEQRYAKAVPLAGTLGQAYVERRGIPLAVADTAGVRFDANFGGRPAVVCAMRDPMGSMASLHGRYLETRRGQNKMLTIGPGGGVFGVLGGWQAEPLILVEGLFDALSLATCGWPAVATVGRWAPWLAEASVNRTLWLAFDTGRTGEAEVLKYRQRLLGADPHRLPPPTRCKDWNTALAKRGRLTVANWLHSHCAVLP